MGIAEEGRTVGRLFGTVPGAEYKGTISRGCLARFEAEI